MTEKKKASAAHMRATEKYEDLNYDKVLVRFPVGTKERIAKTGKSANGYIQEAVFEKLKRDNIEELTTDEIQSLKEHKEKKRKQKEEKKQEATTSNQEI